MPGRERLCCRPCASLALAVKADGLCFTLPWVLSVADPFVLSHSQAVKYTCKHLPDFVLDSFLNVIYAVVVCTVTEMYISEVVPDHLMNKNSPIMMM